MPNTARDVIGVILGEAVHGSRQDRWADMVAIASVIANRATQTGRSMQEVVGVGSQFNAYGKPLPKGASQYSGLAQKALRYVEAFGPVHNATYYATPAAKSNMPKGTAEVLSTKGHVYFSDPQNRPIVTAAGTFKPKPVQPAPQASEQNAQIAHPNPPQRGMAPVEYNMGPRRPNPPGERIQNIVSSSVADVLGPDHRVSVISGRGEYGSNRHRGSVGRAMDFDVINPAGQRVTDPRALTDVAQAAMAKGAQGWGYGNGYMAPGRMHLDTVTPGRNQSHTWGSTANANRDMAAEARKYSLMPQSFYNKHLPPQMAVPGLPRDQAIAAPTYAPAPAQVNAFAPMAASAASPQSMPASLTEYLPTGQQMNGSMAAQQVMPTQEIAPIATSPAIAASPPASPPAPTPAQQMAPPAPPLAQSPSMSDFRAMPEERTSETAPTAKRPEPYVSTGDRMNSASTDVGNFGGLNDTGGIGSNSGFGGLGGFGGFSGFSGIGGLSPTTIGSTIGGLVAGPVGSLIGGLIGRSVTSPVTGPKSSPAQLAAVAQQGYTPGLGFPDAPVGNPVDPSFSNLSYGEMSSISPAAANAISSGVAGLY